MNAGKSTTLLQADFNYRERGMETMLWTAALDDRYGAGQVTSRIGLMAQAFKFDPGSALFAAGPAENAERPLKLQTGAVGKSVTDREEIVGGRLHNKKNR